MVLQYYIILQHIMIIFCIPIIFYIVLIFCKFSWDIKNSFIWRPDNVPLAVVNIIWTFLRLMLIDMDSSQVLPLKYDIWCQVSCWFYVDVFFSFCGAWQSTWQELFRFVELMQAQVNEEFIIPIKWTSKKGELRAGGGVCYYMHNSLQCADDKRNFQAS